MKLLCPRDGIGRKLLAELIDEDVGDSVRREVGRDQVGAREQVALEVDRPDAAQDDAAVKEDAPVVAGGAETARGQRRCNLVGRVAHDVMENDRLLLIGGKPP